MATGGPTITATSGAITGSTTLTVVAAVLTTLRIAPATPSLRVGTTRQLIATGSYSDSSSGDLTTSVTWTSTAGTSVSNTGLVTAVAIGSSTVTAALGSITGSATVSVNDAVVSLAKTGQTTCYNDTGTAIDCDGTGQDGNLQTGVVEPSPRFIVGTGVTANCVTDNLTGLMWARSASPSGVPNNWAFALTRANNLTLCGFSDWRLPNRKELRSLIHYDNYGVASNADALNLLGFSDVRAGYYWTSSNYAPIPSNAWCVDMNSGGVAPINKIFSAHNWPVRAGQ